MGLKRKPILMRQKETAVKELKNRLDVLSAKGKKGAAADKDPLVRKWQAEVRAANRRLARIAEEEKRTEALAKMKAEKAAAPKKGEEAKAAKPKAAPKDGKPKKDKPESAKGEAKPPKKKPEEAQGAPAPAAATPDKAEE